MSDEQTIEFIKPFTESPAYLQGKGFPPYTICEFNNALERLGYETRIAHCNWEDLYIVATKEDGILTVELAFDPYHGGWEIESYPGKPELSCCG